MFKDIGLKMDNYLKQNWDMAATIAITVITFFVMFSFRTLNIYDTDWVVKGGDFTVSYLGSVFYRLDEWRWPIFTHMNLAFPYGISVHGTDGSPLLSLIFKVFHKFFGLPADVQFVGIWMLICYVLQAVASVLIFRHGLKNKFLIIVASLFFVSAPIMMMRVFVHINLMPHFILLFSILLFMNNKLGVKEWIYMGILYSLGILTCPYYLPMSSAFFFLLWYQQVWVEKKVSWKELGIGVASLAALLGFWFYLLGMATTEQNLASGGWRALSLNLSALVNPIWSKSQVFNTLTPKADFDADNYFGLGLLILLVVCFRQVLELFTKKNLDKHGMLALVLAALFVYSLSPNVKIGTVVILDYKPGALIEWIGGVFRYSGRYFWPIWYLLAFYLIKEFCKKMGKKAYVLLPLLLIVQVWDFYPTYKSKSRFIWEAKPIPMDTISPEWDRLAQKYDKVFIFAHNKNYRGVWRWALKNNKKVNYGFLNRASKKTNDLVKNVREEVLNGYVSDPTYFYIIDSDLMKQIDKAAEVNPSVAKLKASIRKVDSYDILEYNPDLKPEQIMFPPKRVPTVHRYWNANLLMVSPHRVYRVLTDGYKDYATVTRYDDEMLILKWDRYDAEEFKKGKDGKYYQIVDGKSIEPNNE